MSNIENKNSKKDRMGLVQALQILHTFRDILREDENFSGRPFFGSVADALEFIFEWIDDIVILLCKSGGGKDGCE